MLDGLMKMSKSEMCLNPLKLHARAEALDTAERTLEEQENPEGVSTAQAAAKALEHH